MFGNSKQVESTQESIHSKLLEHVQKHIKHTFQKPIAEHSLRAFEQVCVFIQKGEEAGFRRAILDACCGVGESSVEFAQRNPEHLVIGIDRSAHRLQKRSEELSNLLLIQSDLLDFYRLAAKHALQFDRHYLLYPNPYPKASQLNLRWHGGPVFREVLMCSPQLELRSNWKLYLEEFAESVNILRQLMLRREDMEESAGLSFESQLEQIETDSTEFTPLTAFERKYQASGHGLWRLTVSGTQPTC